MHPMGKVNIKWSPEFAYAIGLITTDGNLSPDGRHVNFTTKDKQLAKLYCKCLGINNKIGRKARGGELEKKYYGVQFGDVIFYRFLEKLGLTQRKSKTMGGVKIPTAFLFDFLRGHFDGDGTFYSYWDPRWRSSFMFYTVFISASEQHIHWVRDTIHEALKIKGHITKNVNNSAYQLKYAKSESLKLLPKLYYDNQAVCLLRKRVKITAALKVNRQAA